MKRLALAVLIAAAVAAAGYWYASGTAGKRPAGPEVRITRPAVKGNAVVLHEEPVRITPGGDPIAKTIEKVLATAAEGPTHSAIPAGTRLLSLHVHDGLAKINLSREFRALSEQGDTGESLAQNALRSALAQFPAVRKMTVLVDGTLYEGEHSGEWSDIPVRDDAAGGNTP